MRTARQDSIRSSFLKHGRVIELTCRRSDLWWLSALARPTQRINSSRLRLVARHGYLGHMVGTEHTVARKHRPQDARILVGQRRHGLLPTDTFLQLHQPLADAVVAFGRAPHGRLGTLDQQGAQVVVATLGDAPEPGLAPGGVLAGHQAEPGAELARVGKLAEFAHAGDQSRRGGGANAQQRGRLARPRIGAYMGGNALVAACDLQIDVDPVQMRALQGQPCHAGDLVAGVLDHAGQHQAQRIGALGEDHSELGQQAADAVDQRRALFLEALAQTVHGQLALLLGRLDRHEAHVRATSGLADGSGIVGVVLASLARHAVGYDEVASDQPGIQAQYAQPAGHVVRTATSLHRHDTSVRQFGAPGKGPIHRHGLGQYDAALRIDRVHLADPLGQIHPYPRYRRPCNRLPLFRFRLNFRESILVPGHRLGTGEVPLYSFHRTSPGKSRSVGGLQR